MNDSTWTWISGSDTTNIKGIYGEKGNASIENVPGSREGAAGWLDGLKQEFWMFGGNGHSYASLGMRVWVDSIQPTIKLISMSS